MDTTMLEEFVKNPMVWLIWVVLAMINSQISDLITKLGSLLNSPFQGMMRGTTELQEQTKDAINTGKKFIEEVKSLVTKVLTDIAGEIDILIMPIRSSVDKLIGAVAPDDKKIWRIFGALLQMVLFCLFIYADAIQGANNLSTIFPGLVVPEPLRDITFSLLIASVGVVVALGVILADIFGLTHFAPVEKIQGVWKYLYIALVVLTIIIAITLSTMLALSRVPDLVTTLDQASKDQLLRNASYAQSLVILPLLITTAFLYWGAVGFLVLLCGLLLLITLFMKVASYFLGFLAKSIEFGLISTEYLYNLFFGFINLSIRVLYGLFFLLDVLISGVFLVAQSLLAVVLGPPTLVAKWFMAIINYILARLPS